MFYFPRMESSSTQPQISTLMLEHPASIRQTIFRFGYSCWGYFGLKVNQILNGIIPPEWAICIDFHWFSSILRTTIYFGDVYSLRPASLRRSWPRNVILTCFQHFFFADAPHGASSGQKSTRFCVGEGSHTVLQVAKVQAWGSFLTKNRSNMY